MPGFLHKKQWILTLGLGIFGIAFGSLLIAYSITVVQNGPFPDSAITFSTPGYFFIGFGMGYVVCSSVIRSLEKKIP
jgi:hypothetical protein